jgi:Flp pilus assembly protein TadG
MPTRTSAARRGRRTPARRGVITIWTVICLPLAVTVLFGVAQVGRLWHARVQLENALEATALAAVQEWGDRGGESKNMMAALTVGRAYAEANAVLGVPVKLNDRQSAASAAWSFGTATPRGSGFDFTADSEATARFAVVLQATVRVPRLCRSLLGESTITATTVAFYDPSAEPRLPRLIRLNADP